MGRRLRDMSWEDYGISRNRYRELKAFCMQYEEKKQKIAYGTSGSGCGIRFGGGDFKSQVERQAMRNVAYQMEIDMIEKAAVKANPDIWRYLLKSVTKDYSYELVMYDLEQGKIPVGKTDFYAYRRLFFHYLDELHRKYL